MTDTFKFAIKHRLTDDVVFEAELGAHYESYSRGVQLGAAVQLSRWENADLNGADLNGADLRGALLAAENREGKWALHPASQVAVAAYEAGQADAEKLQEAILWALGCRGRFPPREQGQGGYWWRTELRKRAGITASAIAGITEEKT